MIGYAFIFLLIFILFLSQFLKNKLFGLVFLLYFSSLDLNKIFNMNFEIVIKILFLLTYLLLVLKKGLLEQNFLKIVGLGIIFIFNLLIANFDDYYGISDALSGIFSIFVGLCAFLLILSKEEKEYILKHISFIPLFSLLVGIILWPLGIVNPFLRGNYVALSGASNSTNLAFYGFLAFASSLYYVNVTKNEKYRYLAYLNFLIVCGTLTRGALLACIPLILFDLIPMYKFLSKNKIRFVTSIVLFCLMLPVGLIFLNTLLERTFSNNGLNTSGRIEAWNYIINLCENPLLGNGYGFLKTRTDYELRAFKAAHNEFIHFYLETGIIGTIIFFLFFINFYYKRIKISHLRFEKRLIYSIFLGFLIYSIFDNTITNYHFYLTFTLLSNLITTKDVNKIKTMNVESLVVSRGEI